VSDRRTTSFIDQLLSGDVHAAGLEQAVRTWIASDQRRTLERAIGLDAAQLELVAHSPSALRYLVHAIRFGHTIDPARVTSHARVRSHAQQLAAERCDPYELARIEQLVQRLDSVAPDATPDPDEVMQRA
jgi:hypothetical protein